MLSMSEVPRSVIALRGEVAPADAATVREFAGYCAAFEKRYITRALRRTRGHVGKCAKITGLSRRSITDKISHYGIDKGQFKSEE
jgi:DNA-binding NtrC family response regulator